MNTTLKELAAQLEKQLTEVRRTTEAMQAAFGDEAFAAKKAAHQDGTQNDANRRVTEEADQAAVGALGQLSWVLSSYSEAVRGCCNLTAMNSLGVLQTASRIDCQLTTVASLRQLASKLSA